ncbi:type I DNA topoisomerase [Reinekea blandensis]|uniref:DNA topoisomerase 1 n=1 Tax=Reinekea blandensis MED297 TaxID=314283 RepID=A4BDM0_9GAMM|nr:type I DNA topoisomerase [Reinekea blandensis]EAR09629.1 DNA topoisomerase I [Reinekea blandensis MED297]
MGKSLVIVESPAKAKTINKYLGSDYIVKSSVGHIRDLPTSGQNKPVDPKARAKQAALTRKMSPEEKAVYKKKKAQEQLVTRMGIDPAHDWAANYQILPGKEKVVDELRRLAKDADQIYLATDLDREGEAIAWHLQETIGQVPEKYRRVVFNEITKKAINEAFEEPGELDLNRVNAQQARRFLDRVVGFMVSPLLWAKVARGLSAGRVQSVAVKLIVEREREIRAFVPEEFWDLHADLTSDRGSVRFEVTKHQDNKYRPVNKQESDAHVQALQNASYQIANREDKPTSSRPAAPFITSTLQQAASTRLGFSVKKTMMMAQRLYEAGHITYMRTDSTNLSAEAVSSARDFIEQQYGAKYLPEKPNVYGSREGAQEAHEAIRPSDVKRKSASLSDMERDAQRLYELIWQRFVACQMTPAKYKSTTLSIETNEYELKAKGRVLVFDGFTRVMRPGQRDDVVELPDLKVGDKLSLDKLDPKQHFTKPVARFTEASLVKELEKLGIGRPSTYASIISTIQDRGYVRLESRRFYAEKMGDIVTERLNQSFADLMQYQFTAQLEENLDDIADGDKNWKDVLNRFYKQFLDQLDKAEAPAEEGGMKPNEPTLTDIQCPTCSRPMMIRTGTTGVFLGCSGYNLPPKERCKGTLNLVPGDEAISADDDDEAEVNQLRQKERCDICGTAMDSYLIDEGRKLHVCGNNPQCSGFKIERGEFKIKGYEGPTLECDKCGSEMQLKTGRFGKYFGCTNDECKNTRKLLRNGEAAPPKMDPIPMPELQCRKVDDTYVLRDGAAGMFLAASQFPKNRETRPPLVAELVPHRKELPEKYQYLCDAPTEDSQGNPTVIRFSRKTKEQYVMSETSEGKASGWSAWFDNGQWNVTEKPKAKAKAKAKSKPKKAATKKKSS